MSQNQTVRWGIIGVGKIAGKVAPSLAAPKTSELVAVAARDLDRAQAFADTHGAARAYGDYGQLLADPVIDAVYITTPNSLHLEHALAAIEAGKHVLCEKPLAASVADVERMFDAAEAKGVVLMEAFMYRFHPLMREALKLVHEGAIGEPRIVRSTFCFNIGDKPENIRLSRELHGGAIMDIGCYCINFSRAVIGQEPESVSGAAHIGLYGVDAWTSGTLGFPGGATASFNCAVQCGGGASAQIWGSEGTIEIENPWQAGEPEATFRYKPVGAKEAEVITVSSAQDRYFHQTVAFNRAVLEGAPLLLTREDSIGNARVIERLHQAIGLSFDR